MNLKTMTFEYSCFISYRGSKDAMTQQFITELVEGINLCTGQLLNGQTVYLDKDRLQGGERFQPALADAMVRSYCMVAVLSPAYIGSDFCCREYTGMLEIESRRKNAIGKPAENRSLVIALHVWGPEEDLPKIIRDHIHVIKMPYGLSNRRKKIHCDPNFIPFLQKLGEIIHCHSKDYQDKNTKTNAIKCCEGFALPELTEENKWLPPQQKVQPFPGRKKPVQKRRAK